jgi:cellulose synthase/poly-beta-1,6-N-acetylglucosamine synthase-like glycosyltransferase
MLNLLVGVLTDRYPKKLERCLKSIDGQGTTVGRVVVCNTLDLEHIPLASAIAEKYGWKFIVTESNGTCSKGKNSVLDYFATTDYDYLTLIDGDDYVEPNSLSILERVIDKYDPDVVGLIGSSAVVGDERIPLSQWEISDDWRTRTRERIESAKNARKLILLYERAKKLLEFNRFVVISKRCLEFFRFSENIRISDIHLSLKLKHYVNQGLLKYIIIDSDNIYTYDGNDFGDFGHFLTSDPNISTAVFWEELEGLNLAGEILVIKEDDG